MLLLLVSWLDDDGQCLEVLPSTDDVVSLFCKGLRVLLGGGPLILGAVPSTEFEFLLLLEVEFLATEVSKFRKSAKASLLVLDRVTGAELNGSSFQTDEEPNGSIADELVSSLRGVVDELLWLILARLLAEKGSKESSRLLLTGTLAALPLPMPNGSMPAELVPQAVDVDEVLLTVSQLLPKGSTAAAETEAVVTVEALGELKGSAPGVTLAPKAADTGAVKGSSWFLKGSAPSRSNGSPYRWSLNGSSLNSNAEYFDRCVGVGSAEPKAESSDTQPLVGFWVDNLEN